MYKNILRGIFALLVGCCLLIWPTESTELILKILGGVFIAAGVVIIIYLLASDALSNFKALTLVNIVSAVVFILLGFLLIFRTDFFEKFANYLFGTILIVYGVLQLIQTYRFNKGGGAKPVLYIIPILTVLVGGVFFFNVISALNVFTVIFGIALIFLGLSELFIGGQLGKINRKLKEEADRAASKINKEEGNVVDVEAEEVTEEK